MPVTGVGVPGRHAALRRHFLEHAGVLGSVVIAHERERGGLPRPVAGLAAVLEDAGDILRVGYAGFRVFLLAAVDDAAVGLDLGRGDWLAGEEFIDRRGGAASRRLLAWRAGGILIIDPAAVAQDEFAVQECDGWHARRPDGVSQALGR